MRCPKTLINKHLPLADKARLVPTSHWRGQDMPCPYTTVERTRHALSILVADVPETRINGRLNRIFYVIGQIAEEVNTRSPLELIDGDYTRLQCG